MCMHLAVLELAWVSTSESMLLYVRFHHVIFAFFSVTTDMQQLNYGFTHPDPCKQ